MLHFAMIFLNNASLKDWAWYFVGDELIGGLQASGNTQA